MANLPLLTYRLFAAFYCHPQCCSDHLCPHTSVNSSNYILTINSQNWNLCIFKELAFQKDLSIFPPTDSVQGCWASLTDVSKMLLRKKNTKQRHPGSIYEHRWVSKRSPYFTQSRGHLFLPGSWGTHPSDLLLGTFPK